MAENVEDAPKPVQVSSPAAGGWWLLQALWWGVYLLLVLPVLRGPALRLAGTVRADGAAAWFDLAIVVVLVGLLTLLFAAGARGIEALRGALSSALPVAEKQAATGKGKTGVGFPAPVTLATGVWLLVSTLVVTAAMVAVLAAPDWLTAALGREGRVADVLVTMLGGAVGGNVAGIVAYLDHACEKRDFDLAYVPWYLARPLLGLLLGAIAYFLVKGGLLVTVPATAGEDFNDFGLAAVGTLVGLFSKNALEKLREVFHVVFASRADLRREVEDQEAGAAGDGAEPSKSGVT